ncbi:MAG: SEC-C domain-containing protein, partial [Desulfobulbaceae bacterium]|nr:SEC-C domain-containing protein [Desulfobulbaceae bacterium]
MGKIGRNDPCPCRSGLKYKKCCQKKERDGEERPVVPDSSSISLSVEVEKIRKSASEKKEKILSIGVFI